MELNVESSIINGSYVYDIYGLSKECVCFFFLKEKGHKKSLS